MVAKFEVLKVVAVVSCCLIPGLSSADGRRCPMGADGTAFVRAHGGPRSALGAARRLLLRDTDLDGIPNCLERVLGLNPRRADSKNDGIEDADRVQISGHSIGELYDLGLFDSDGDGLNDAAEFSESPKKVYLADSVGDGLLDGERALLSQVREDDDDDDDDDDDRPHRTPTPTPIPSATATPTPTMPPATPVPTVTASPSPSATPGGDNINTKAKKCRKLRARMKELRLSRNFDSLQRKYAKRCKKAKKPTPAPTKKPTASPTAKPTGNPNPNPTATATPKPTATATPKPTATATPKPTATPTPTPSGGNAAAGRSFYSANCTSCHGVKSGKSASQIQSSMSSVSSHSVVKSRVTSQVLADLAAYLAAP